MNAIAGVLATEFVQVAEPANMAAGVSTAIAAMIVILWFIIFLDGVVFKKREYFTTQCVAAAMEK